ncbi:MAG TPA: hypothetical protein VGM78_14815, partial [Ilumatobacteraceae bacterium]
MPRLVALALPAGQAFVEALQRVWDHGDAVLPVDDRLPVAAADALMRGLGASAVVDLTGEQTLTGGRPTEEGDALVIA